MNFKNLRVLVVLPMYGGSLPIGRYCAKALQDLGCSVRTFNAPVFYSTYEGIGELDLSETGGQSLRGHLQRLVSQAIWTMVQEQKPQLLLAMAQAPIDRSLLKRISGAGARTVMWFVEDYRIFGYWQYMAPAYDAFAVIQKEPFLELLRKAGQQHALYLPLAALPEFHKPQNLTEADRTRYGARISFLGAGYPNRRAAFRPLLKRGLKIWGNDWDGERKLAAAMQEGGRRIPEDEAVKIYCATDINLNLHSSVMAEPFVSGGDFVNPRTFELASCGAFQVVDRRDLLDELFTPDELPRAANEKEFYDLIEYYLDHPEEAAEIANRARKRVLAEHTYQQRMLTLLDYMAHSFGLAPQENTNSLQHLPKSLQESLKAVREQLDLSAEASFEDIVAALRRESGPLSETATALLFLDEWQKLYRSPAAQAPGSGE